MTDKEKLKEIKKLADSMYYAAMYLTTDASRLHKAMDEYHKFTIHECKEEPVSKDFTKALAECIHKAQCSVVDPLAHAEVWEEELVKLVKCEEPVSEGLEEAANEIVNKAIPSLAVKYKDGTYVGKIMDCFDRKEFIDLVKAGAQWQKQKDNNNANHALVEQIKTQQMCYEKGIADMRQQMMAKAIDVEVHVDADSYPYIPQMELYDYDKDIPLAKEGDKYKVVLIKED